MATDSFPLHRSLAIQFRVIGALLLREIVTRYGRHNIGMLWLVIEPILFILIIATMWTVGNLHAITKVPIIAFAITGYSCLFVWRNTTNRCGSAIEPNLGLMHHRNVKVIDIFISRVLLELISSTASLVALTVVFAFIGAMQWPKDIVLILEGWLLLCWFGYALACTVGVLSERSEMFTRVWRVVFYHFGVVSGAFFMVDWLPVQSQALVLWIPMVHGVEMVRHGFFGNIVPTHENPTFLILTNLFLTLISLILLRVTGRKGYSK